MTSPHAPRGFRRRATLAFACYAAVLIAAGVFFYLKLFGMLPMLMILAAVFGMAQLACKLLLADSDDYLDELHEERGGRRKRIVFFDER